jgi:HK97 family phage major capsid protein
MPWPTTDPTGIVGHIIGEAVQDSFTDFSFGTGMLQAWTYSSGVILASYELLNDAAFDLEGFIRDRIAEAIGRALAAHLQTGSGTGQPLGIQTALAAASGLTSGGVYQSPAASGAKSNTLAGQGASGPAKLASGIVDFNDALGMIHSIDPAYRASGRCQWVMNDTTLQMFRSLTDDYGRPLWMPSVAGGQPDTLLNFPYTIDQNTGNVPTAAATTGGLLFGDFQTAMVLRRVNQADVMRLNERYADARQVGFFGFVRQDARSDAERCGWAA